MASYPRRHLVVKYVRYAETVSLIVITFLMRTPLYFIAIITIYYAPFHVTFLACWITNGSYLQPIISPCSAPHINDFVVNSLCVMAVSFERRFKSDDAQRSRRMMPV